MKTTTVDTKRALMILKLELLWGEFRKWYHDKPYPVLAYDEDTQIFVEGLEYFYQSTLEALKK